MTLEKEIAPQTYRYTYTVIRIYILIDEPLAELICSTMRRWQSYGALQTHDTTEKLTGGKTENGSYTHSLLLSIFAVDSSPGSCFMRRTGAGR